MTTRADQFFAGDCVFAFGAANVESMPPPHLPEFALIGRSNVGKSSLFNALTGRPSAHVSATPGRTQQLNFFLLSRRCYLVDVPGYGFAKAPKAKITAWQNLLRGYLRKRTVLQQLFVLIDARHGVVKTDTAMLDELDRVARGYRVLLTKCDMLKPEALAKVQTSVEAVLRRHPAAYPEAILTSAKYNTGIALLRKTIFECL